MFDIWGLLLAFLTSTGLCLLAIKRPALFMNKDHMMRDLSARQAQHTRPTPRVGGAAVVCALLVGGLFHAQDLERDLVLSLLAGFFVFWVGLREDVHRDVSSKIRLLAAFVSAGLAIALTGHVVPGLGVVQTDIFFNFFIVGFAVTMVWSAGTCNALNLIDGLNGLSSGYVIFASLGLFAIAGQTGDQDIQIATSLLIAATLGFFILNWPLGRIFMGDAGAYAIGHVLAWLGILLMARHPEVSGFSILLILFWPVGDTIFSMIRRRLTRKATDQSDRLHFHHLVVRALPLLLNRRLGKARYNSIATVLIYPLMIAPIVVGVMHWNQPVKALFYLLLFTLLFIMSYAFGMEYFASHNFRRTKAVGQMQGAGSEALETISNLSGVYIQDSMAVDLRIYRPQGTATWRVHVSADGAEDHHWTDQFQTDLAAWQAFLHQAQEFGIHTVIGSLRDY